METPGASSDGSALKACVVIPVFNHALSIAEVVRDARRRSCPVIVVDDGSTDKYRRLCLLEWNSFVSIKNRGKGAALRAGLAKAVELGYTHAISMDADGQHFADDIPKFLMAAADAPESLLVGVRDFLAAGAPAGRRRSNQLSSFWFRVATNVRLADTQCGFRCYPLSEFQKLRIKAERYAFELESLARAAWAGIPLVGVPVRVRYAPELIRGSHFRPIVDFARITKLQICLVLQAWFVPAKLRRAWSLGENRAKRRIALLAVVGGLIGLALLCRRP